MSGSIVINPDETGRNYHTRYLTSSGSSRMHCGSTAQLTCNRVARAILVSFRRLFGGIRLCSLGLSATTHRGRNPQRIHSTRRARLRYIQNFLRIGAAFGRSPHQGPRISIPTEFIHAGGRFYGSSVSIVDFDRSGWSISIYWSTALIGGTNAL